MIKVEKFTPEIYSKESRDYQLMCRVYDCIFNSTKADVDSIIHLLNTDTISSTFLPLLKTKLGYNSETILKDDELRYILRVFPYIIRAKGSTKAVEQMVNMCLKLYNLNADYQIRKGEEGSVFGDITLDQHSILIGIDTVLRSTELLRELCEYVMPSGFQLYVYFYQNVETADMYAFTQNTQLLFSSKNINSGVRGTVPSFAVDDEDRLIGAIDTIFVSGADSDVSSSFVGVFSEIPSGTFTDGQVCVIANDDSTYSYIYDGEWKQLNFKGLVPSLQSQYTGHPEDYDCVGIVNDTTRRYLMWDYNEGLWRSINCRGSIDTAVVLAPNEYDFVNPQSGAKLYRNAAWVPLGTYLGTIGTLPEDPQDLSYAFVDGASYYIYGYPEADKWNSYSEPLYMMERHLYDYKGDEING